MYDKLLKPRQSFGITLYAVSTRIDYEIVPVTNINKCLQYGKVELNNVYIDIGANSSSEKLRTVKTLRLPVS